MVRAPQLVPAWLLPLACVSLLMAPGPSSAGDLTPLEWQGKQIYRTASSPSAGALTAVMGREGIEVPGTIVPCVNCHGHDGLGRAESGLEPSNITWEALSRPYPVTSPDGRTHPAYDERSLLRAFTMGVDPAGNQLDPAMPRYRMTHAAAEALVAYLKMLGRERDPGMGDKHLRLGVILPPAGPLDGLGEVVRKVLGAYAQRVHRRGGIYDRRLDLVFLIPPLAPEARTAAVRSLLEHGDIFALTASFLMGADLEVASLVQELEVPLVAAFNLDPAEALPFNRYIFHIGPSLGEQARALLQFAADELRGQAKRAVIVHPGDPDLARVAQGMVEQGARQGPGTPWSSIQVVDYAAGLDAPALVREQSRLGTNVVFFLGSDTDALALLREARALHWKPYLLMSSPLLGEGVLGELEEQADRVFLSFPAWSSQVTQRHESLYGELSADFDLPRRHLSVQLSALGAAEVIAEALRRSGRDVTREKLVDSLEEFDDFDTGLIPHITYGPNRRMGALGAYVVSFDPDRVRSEWVELRY